jgi:hypothetical protein
MSPGCCGAVPRRPAGAGPARPRVVGMPSGLTGLGGADRGGGCHRGRGEAPALRLAAGRSFELTAMRQAAGAGLRASPVAESSV